MAHVGQTMKTRLAALAVCFAALTALPALAQSWGADVVQVDVLDGGTAADGTHRAAIRFTLAEGWKTYWRAPGDAGIPPLFSWTGSRNVAATQMIWPTPQVFDQNGMRSIGYKNQLVLPIAVTPREPGQPLRLKGKVELGVCEEVCIPATVRFDQMLDPAAPRHPAIIAALSDRPLSAEEAGVTAAYCVIAPSDHGLRVEAHIRMPHAGGTEYIVMESGNPLIWVSESDTRRSGDTLIAVAEMIHASAAGFALDRSALRFTVLGSDHAVDVQGCQPG
jgi:DsbC/DsbD-like thiol-disulfide interchange protein